MNFLGKAGWRQFFRAGDSFFEILGRLALASQPCLPSKEILYFVMQEHLFREIPLKKFKLNLNGNLICRNSLIAVVPVFDLDIAATAAFVVENWLVVFGATMISTTRVLLLAWLAVVWVILLRLLALSRLDDDTTAAVVADTSSSSSYLLLYK